MKKVLCLVIMLLALSSHDMYLKPDHYYLEPNTDAIIVLYNGTFTRSDNTIDRTRMLDVSLAGNGSRMRVDTSQWTERDKETLLHFTTGPSGTWVAGVSTRARTIEMEARDFNDYLEHDGVLDMLEWRKENDALDQDAAEKYSKHVKTIFQVGEQRTDDWEMVLGYPIEFVPLDNPYELGKGGQLRIKLLWQGQPLADQMVYAGHRHAHDDEDHGHAGDTAERHQHDATPYRTNADGEVTVVLEEEGEWYLRTIHMAFSEEEGLTHESNWATLTFQVGHSHTHGLPHYFYWAVVILLLVGILFWLRAQKSRP